MEEEYYYTDLAAFYNDTEYFIFEEENAPSAGLAAFHKTYRDIHGPLSVIICLFGITANIFSVIVLTRKNMASPTNYILTALGIADIFALFSYLMFVLYAYIFTPSEHYTESFYRGWIDYAIIWTHISYTFEIYGMWLTITLAVFQFISVCLVSIANRVCTLGNSLIAIVITGVVSIVMVIPVFLLYETKELPPEFSGTNATLWYLGDSRIVEDEPGFKKFYLVFYGIVVKMTACILLIVLSSSLLYAMRRVIRKRETLLRQNSEERRKDERRRVHYRTTIMLVTVVMVFVVTEFPKGIMALIGGVDRDFFQTVMIPLDDFFIMLTLINNAVKFILYCAMSHQFRVTFSRLFVKKLKRSLSGKDSKDRETDRTSSSGRTRESEDTHL